MSDLYGEQVNGVTLVRFTRTFGDGRYPLTRDSTVNMIASYGSSDTIAYHSVNRVQRLVPLTLPTL